jgi:hypothetical protein
LSISDNLRQVENRIAETALRSGRNPREVKLVAVSKTFPADKMLEALTAGARILGENRIQEARAKFPAIEKTLRDLKGEFHLVGHLQRNKAKEAVRLFDLIHSIDSERIAREVNRRAEEIGKIQRVLIEVNTSGEPQKYGIPPQETEELVEIVSGLLHLKLEGLMTVGPLYGGLHGARECFRLLRRLRDEAGGADRLPELSMGMTADFEIAVEEGSTMVRIGTAIFGERN